MSIATDLAAGLSELETELASPTFLWGVYTIACAPSTERRGLVLQVGGVEKAVAMSLIVRVAAFADGLVIGGRSPIYPGQKLTYLQKIYRVLDISETSIPSHFSYDIGDPN